MKHERITVDESLLAQVDRAGKALGLKRSEIVRRALREWLRKRAIAQFERGWVESLQEHPDDHRRADQWLDAKSWGDE